MVMGDLNDGRGKEVRETALVRIVVIVRLQLVRSRDL